MEEEKKNMGITSLETVLIGDSMCGVRPDMKIINGIKVLNGICEGCLCREHCTRMVNNSLN